MRCGLGWCGHCQLGPTLICRDGPVYSLGRARAPAGGARAVSAKPTLAVWKFASCDGCQLSLLDCEDELLALAGEVDIALLPRGRRRACRGAVRPLARRGLGDDRARRRADPRGARSFEATRHDRRVRDRRRDPGPEELRRRRRLHLDRLRHARPTSRRSQRRRRSRRTSRSTTSCTAARSTSASCSR